MFMSWPPTNRTMVTPSVARYLVSISDAAPRATPLSEVERRRLYKLLDLEEIIEHPSSNQKLFPNFQPRSR